MGLLGKAIGGGVTALGGLFPSNETTDQTTKQDTNTQTTGSQNNYSASDINSLLQTLSELVTKNQSSTSGSVTPTLSPESAQFMNSLIGKYTNLTNNGPNLAPYQAQQTQQINNNSNLQSQAVNNILAARGLATSPVAGTANANIQAGRVGQISQLGESIPLLQQQIQRENLGAAGGFFGQLPRGSMNQGLTSSEGSQQGNTMQTGQTTGVNTSDTNSQVNSVSHGNTTTNQTIKKGGGFGGFLSALGPVLSAIIP